jgi:DNA ligase (NAD+)
MALSISDIEAIESFAEKSATELVVSLKAKKVLIDKLISYGFDPKHKVASVVDSGITGLKFCITGTLTLKRTELQKMVKENGGIVQSGVSKDTNYLITNDVESSSSKFKKAKSLNLPIITEEKFFKLIGK